MISEQKWNFPEKIGIIDVTDYVEKAKKFNLSDTIVFDLRNTIDMHSSYIGFLIQMKHLVSKNNGKFVLLLSFTAERILTMLNIIDYFVPNTVTVFKRKSA